VPTIIIVKVAIYDPFQPFQRFALTLPLLVANAQDAPSEQSDDRLSASHS
jgi:hypothetical protein